MAVASMLALGLADAATAAERIIKIAGFGAKSGVVRSFGVNAEAVLRAATDDINNSGGVRLGDGSIGKFQVDFFDTRCNAEEGISIVRRLASADYLIAVGPTCSNVAEPVFGILQAKVGDSSDTGLQFPIFTDGAIKGGLAKISEWSFRNVPSEDAMYKALFVWLAEKHPDAKTVFGGVEEDFAHSRFTWYSVMKERSVQAKFEVVGEAKWLLNDTNFTTQVREMKKANADIVSISSHPFTTCGVLKEMARQRVKPRVALVGLTSSSSMETLNGCAAQAEGIIIPTSFAPTNAKAQRVAELTAKYGGSADLHSTAAWENVEIIRDVIVAEKVMAKPETVQQDRRRMRDGLAKLKSTAGLMGTIARTEDREAVKPFVYATAKEGAWVVLYDPAKASALRTTGETPALAFLPQR
ncbi:MAG: ABC transporter substrate-binding protein [Candidatus Lambdaproteobacteria bacterium]|nr:ABC transporter substrate-binding protein [Candidatus Lambdaproteobacteria bacterium]